MGVTEDDLGMTVDDQGNSYLRKLDQVEFELFGEEEEKEEVDQGQGGEDELASDLDSELENAERLEMMGEKPLDGGGSVAYGFRRTPQGDRPQK